MGSDPVNVPRGAKWGRGKRDGGRTRGVSSGSTGRRRVLGGTEDGVGSSTSEVGRPVAGRTRSGVDKRQENSETESAPVLGSGDGTDKEEGLCERGCRSGRNRTETQRRKDRGGVAQRGEVEEFRPWTGLGDVSWEEKDSKKRGAEIFFNSEGSSCSWGVPVPKTFRTSIDKEVGNLEVDQVYPCQTYRKLY